MTPLTIDARRQLIVPGDALKTLEWCVEHFIDCANRAIEQRGRFVVALSGGSTPHGIYKALALLENQKRIDWQRALLFWSDERAVPPNDPESNYHTAMEAGLGKLAVPAHQIFRMEAEGDTVAGAQRYESCLNQHLPGQPFDLMMIGMGDDGHVASLFPRTEALKIQDRRAAANEVPQKQCWRMTLTFPEINLARAIACYVIGGGKAKRLAEVLRAERTNDPKELLPAQFVGTASQPCLWIADNVAASQVRVSE